MSCGEEQTVLGSLSTLEVGVGGHLFPSRVSGQPYTTHHKPGSQYLFGVENYVIQLEVSVNQALLIVIMWQVFH